MTNHAIEQEKIIEVIKKAAVEVFADNPDRVSIKSFVTDQEFFYSNYFDFDPLLQRTKNELAGTILSIINNNMGYRQVSCLEKAA